MSARRPLLLIAAGAVAACGAITSFDNFVGDGASASSSSSSSSSGSSSASSTGGASSSSTSSSSSSSSTSSSSSSGTPDAGAPDSTPDSTPDTGTPDTGTPDTGTPDSTPDTGTPDSTPDTGTPDTGTPDTGLPCVLKTTGLKVGTTANQTGSGTAWTNTTGAALAADGSNWVRALIAPDQESSYLVVAGFGFAVPKDASVRGVRVILGVRQLGGAGEVEDRSVQLAPGGQPTGTEHRKGDALPMTTFGSLNFGGGADLWGLPLTPSVVNAASFGVGFTARNKAISGQAAADVDTLSVEITYCE